MNKPENKGWFPMPKLRLGMAVTVLIIVLVSVNTFTYSSISNGTALINWLLMGIMFVCLVVMLIDNLSADVKVDKKSKASKDVSKGPDEGGISQ
jgi:Na+-transporting NADH:ubiquinone oxidoreductase subunit NqrE